MFFFFDFRPSLSDINFGILALIVPLLALIVPLAIFYYRRNEEIKREAVQAKSKPSLKVVIPAFLESLRLRSRQAIRRAFSDCSAVGALLVASAVDPFLNSRLVSSLTDDPPIEPVPPHAIVSGFIDQQVLLIVTDCNAVREIEAIRNKRRLAAGGIEFEYPAMAAMFENIEQA